MNTLEGLIAQRRIRERLGRYKFVNPQEAALGAKQGVWETIEHRLEDLQKVNGGFNGLVDLLKTQNLPMTRAYLTSLYVQMIVGEPLEKSGFNLVENVDTDRVSSGAGALDMAKGIRITIGAVQVAHRSAYETMDKATTSLEKEAAQLLKEDPSGFSVIDWQIDKICQSRGGWVERFEIPEFVIAGAELAAETYKKVYPVAEKVFNK